MPKKWSLFRSDYPMLDSAGSQKSPAPATDRLSRVLQAGAGRAPTPAGVEDIVRLGPKSRPRSRPVRWTWASAGSAVLAVVLIAAVAGLLGTTLSLQSRLEALSTQTHSAVESHETALVAAGLLQPRPGTSPSPSPSPSPSRRPTPPEVSALLDSAREGASLEDRHDAIRALELEDRLSVALAALEAVQASAAEGSAAAHAVLERLDAVESRVRALEDGLAGASSGLAAANAAIASTAAAAANASSAAAAEAAALQAVRDAAQDDAAQAANATAEAARAGAAALAASLGAETVRLREELERVNASAAAAARSALEAVGALELAPGPRGPAGANGSCVRFDDGEPIECPTSAGYATTPVVTALRGQVATLSRVAWMLQQTQEQRIRAEGASGVTSVRGVTTGSRSYHDGTDVDGSALSIHDHSDFVNTMGMGELAAAINGFAFVTRHNDYRLASNAAVPEASMRSLDPLDFPDVPPSVLALPTVDEQAAELREYFKAFRDSDHSHRDYRPYFRPALCVLEMAWLKADEELVDPFASDRHQLAAASWDELRAKLAWLLDTGHKDTSENLGFLPSSVRGVEPDGTPVLANLDYRIFCHKLRDHLPLSQLRVSKHLASRLSRNTPLTTSALQLDRRARFDINTSPSTDGAWAEGTRNWQKVDDLMAQIPGRDGYAANISDWEYSASQRVLRETYQYQDKTQRLNAGFFHRFYRTGEKDAMGAYARRRGFRDMTLWAARTTQPEVVGVKNPAAGEGPDPAAEHKWTYAVPLEVVYMTPLLSWNPYNLTYHGSLTSSRGCAPYARGASNERTGDPEDPARAYNGSCLTAYFRTPERFFDPAFNTSTSPADTGHRVTGVLDPQGRLRRVRPSGTHIVLPEIEGVGRIRLRYPVYPTHWEGSDAWKEVKALQSVVLEASADGSAGGLEDIANNFGGIDLHMGAATAGIAHEHTLSVPSDLVQRFEAGLPVTATSSLDAGHTHDVTVTRSRAGASWAYSIQACDGTAAACADGHSTLRVQE